jgi:excisionase family DNA binding protein
MPSTTYKPRADDPLWSDERVAAHLDVSRVTVRRLRRDGLLPTVKVRGAARTPRSAVLAYVARQMTGGAA